MGILDFCLYLPGNLMKHRVFFCLHTTISWFAVPLIGIPLTNRICIAMLIPAQLYSWWHYHSSLNLSAPHAMITGLLVPMFSIFFRLTLEREYDQLFKAICKEESTRASKNSIRAAYQ